MENNICPNCGAALEPTADKCKYCGYTYETKSNSINQAQKKLLNSTYEFINKRINSSNKPLQVVTKIFMLLSIFGISITFLILLFSSILLSNSLIPVSTFNLYLPSIITLTPLCWMIPMTVKYFKAVKNNQKLPLAFKICCLIFCNIISGILMITDNDL